MPEPWFILFAAIVVAVLIYSFYAAAKRRKALRDWATAHGLSFSEAHDSDMDERFPDFSCLRQGDSRYAYNVMEGLWQGRLPIVAFDYHYTTGSGKSRSDHQFSAVIARAPLALRPLLIRREGLFDKVTEFLGMDDIDFESAEFSRRFFVKSPDKRWAYDVIHPRMMEYLLSAQPLSVQFDLMHIATWNSLTFEPARFEAAAEHVRKIIDLLPEYLASR